MRNDAPLGIASPCRVSQEGEDAAMEQRQRFLIFFFGAILGVVLLYFFKTQSQPARDERMRVRESLSLPGMMYDYAVAQKGFYGHFVLSSSIVTQPDGKKVRTIITGGRRHYTPEGKELPEEYLCITETYAAGTALAEAGPVIAYDFRYADRLTIRCKPGHQASEIVLPSGDKAVAKEGRPQEATLSLRGWLKSQPKPAWSSLPDLVKSLESHPAIASVELTKIDWQAEAEIIKSHTPQ